MAPAILTLIAVALFTGSLFFIAHAKAEHDPDAGLGLIAYAAITLAAFAMFAVAWKNAADANLLIAMPLLFFTLSIGTILRFGPYRPKQIEHY